jgi:hypothetical protein
MGEYFYGWKPASEVAKTLSKPRLERLGARILVADHQILKFEVALPGPG